jgi:hypothetical protein
MRRCILFTLALLLALSTWVAESPAAQGERIMMLPVKAKYLGMDKEVAAFTDLLQDHFAKQPRIVSLSEDQLQALLGNATGNRQQLIKVAGEQLNCQAALLITLERFRERLGDEYSATEPASLAFEYQLVGTADGKVLCYGQFDETQEPLSENILAIGKAFKRGFKWITVDELTREALNRKFESCPALSTNSD